jgi:ankyrin repeat protein
VKRDSEGGHAALLTVAYECAGSKGMNVWDAAEAGNLAEVQRLVGEDPSRLNTQHGPLRMTPVVSASRGGRVEVVQWLLDHGAAIGVALFPASGQGHTRVVRLLLERGADPSIPNIAGYVP